MDEGMTHSCETCSNSKDDIFLCLLSRCVEPKKTEMGHYRNVKIYKTVVGRGTEMIYYDRAVTKSVL